MKTLKKLLLINWHYFTHQLIEFDMLNFMTGVNASGKSTVIDALQLALLGDTRGNYFNKSASGKSARTVVSYLCGEISDNTDGGFHYLRDERFTSYVVTEFYDDEKKRSFTFGCVFDVYSPSDITTRFFRYLGALPEDHFIENQVPLGIAALRERMRSGKYKEGIFHETGRNYREDICSLFGGIQDKKFGDLLKKAVAFNPDNNIQSFITNFVCDSEQVIDVSTMQSNIRSYKDLEQTAKQLEDKRSALEKISDIFTECERSRENERLYEYLIKRAEYHILENKQNRLRQNILAAEQKLSETREELQKETENYDRLTAQYEDLKVQLAANTTQIRLKEITNRVAELDNIIKTSHAEFEKASSQIGAARQRFLHIYRDINERTSGSKSFLADSVCAELSLSLTDVAQRICHKYEAFGELTPEKVSMLTREELPALSEHINAFREIAVQLSGKADELLKIKTEARQELENEKADLERGIFKFPGNALDLKQAVSARIFAETGMRAEVTIVAENAEIKDDRWRNVIEGYLNTQKFYIITAPQHMKIAIGVFNKIKRERSVYDTGLVDIEKIMKKKPYAEKGSLAEEIETNDPYVRAYLDHLLGHVIKCSDAQHIRDHSVSVTDEGLLYKNYVVRAINPKLWENPAIGSNAKKLRLRKITEELESVRRTLEFVHSLSTGAKSCKKTESFSVNDIDHYKKAADGALQCGALEKELHQLEEERASLDTGDLLTLHDLIESKKNMRDKSESRREQLQKKTGSVEKEISQLKDEEIPDISMQLQQKNSELSAAFDDEWKNDVGEPRYKSEYAKRKSPEAISEAFPRERSKAGNAVARLREELVSRRTEYNHLFKMGFDVNSSDNAEFDEALNTIRENTLPNYLSRIEDTKKKAMEEFQEDFLSKLSANISSVKRDIEELNLAISSASFGDDTYRFTVDPSREYERFYRMITDEMLMSGGYNLMSESFNEKYRSELDELFSIMTGDGRGDIDRSEHEKRIRLFTDYRTYLSFDIEVKSKSGEVQRLSRTIDKKSGGETQTPFYIAILASFAQLYRIGRDKRDNTTRLIIFDEAFSKMDGERIEKSLLLLRKIGFQVILSTPTEKAGDIAPWVDRVLLVLRKGRQSQVTVFGKERIGELTDE